MILQTPHDPVFVMFDDSGLQGEGPGETAMKYVAMHPDIEVLGVIAVASKLIMQSGRESMYQSMQKAN